MLKRALDLGSDLFHTLEDRGHRVLFQPPNARYDRALLHLWDEGKSRNNHFSGWAGPAPDTVALVNEVAIALTLFEISAEFGTRWDQGLNERLRSGPPPNPKPGEPFDCRIP